MEEQKAETTETPEKETVVREPETLEEAKAKIFELQTQLNASKVTEVPKVLTPEERAKREKEVRFFRDMQKGAYFIKFIIDDLFRHGYNRTKRRRLLNQIINKKFTTELIETYIHRVDEIVAYMESLVAPKVEPVDAVELMKKFNDAETKAEEPKNES